MSKQKLPPQIQHSCGIGMLGRLGRHIYIKINGIKICVKSRIYHVYINDSKIPSLFSLPLIIRGEILGKGQRKMNESNSKRVNPEILRLQQLFQESERQTFEAHRASERSTKASRAKQPIPKHRPASPAGKTSGPKKKPNLIKPSDVKRKSTPAKMPQRILALFHKGNVERAASFGIELARGDLVQYR